MKNTLHLVLTKKWFDMILSGEKKEEYRELTNYWLMRLDGSQIRGIFDQKLSKQTVYSTLSHNADIINKENKFYKFKTITFSHGYSTNRDQFIIELTGIKIKKGKKKWGAISGIKYFVLELGEILNQ